MLYIDYQQHQKRAGGIAFTDKYGVIKTDDENTEEKKTTDKEPIPVGDHSQEDEEGPTAIEQREYTR